MLMGPRMVEKGSPLGGGLSGYNTESLTVDHSEYHFGDCHAPCLLTTSFVDFEKE